MHHPLTVGQKQLVQYWWRYFLEKEGFHVNPQDTPLEGKQRHDVHSSLLKSVMAKTYTYIYILCIFLILLLVSFQTASTKKTLYFELNAVKKNMHAEASGGCVYFGGWDFSQRRRNTFLK